MAIQPIDLQTLFTQLDKVGKNQTAQKEGLQIQQALQGEQIQRKTDERIQSVNEADDTGDGAESVKDRSSRGNAGEGKQKREENGEKTDEESPGESRIFQDPDLGQNIDVSG
jgi:hypothetical protein